MAGIRELTKEELLSIKRQLAKRYRFLYETILGSVIRDQNEVDLELMRRETRGQVKGHDHTA